MKIFKANVSWSDSFQELVDCWNELGYCKVEKSTDSYSWIDSDKKILLHEHDRVSNLPYFDFALFANEVIKQNNTRPWIYWPRFPKKLNSFIEDNHVKSYESRGIKSIFVGCAENYIQYVNRTKYDWNLAVDEYDFNFNFSSNPHKYTNEEYLNTLSNCKFGLSLEGFGNKCQRDIEYMALGVVPIFTWDTFNDYYEPLVENKHYFYAKNPREVKEKINSCSRDQWEEMSKQCIDWYNRNCSIEGSFLTTLKILNEQTLISNS
jgi:hypothetical protein